MSGKTLNYRERNKKNETIIVLSIQNLANYEVEKLKTVLDRLEKVKITASPVAIIVERIKAKHNEVQKPQSNIVLESTNEEHCFLFYEIKKLLEKEFPNFELEEKSREKIGAV
jgi:hypothetical protein